MEKKTQPALHRKRLIYEGRSKRVYETTQRGIAIIEFKTDFSRNHDGKQSDHIHKAQLSASISHHIFSYLQSFRIPNHHVDQFGKNELVVRRLEMIPISVVVRNIAAGSLCARYGLSEGRELEFPIVELKYKNESLNNPMVNESHVFAFGISTPEEVRTMVRIATKTNAVMRSFVERRQFRLVDIWMEFGRADGQILLGDEITPDTCRFLDIDTNALYDGSIYRLGVGDYRSAYQTLYQRLTS